MFVSFCCSLIDEDIKFSWLNTSVGREDVFLLSPKSWFGAKISPKKADEDEEQEEY